MTFLRRTLAICAVCCLWLSSDIVGEVHARGQGFGPLRCRRTHARRLFRLRLSRDSGPIIGGAAMGVGGSASPCGCYPPGACGVNGCPCNCSPCPAPTLIYDRMPLGLPLQQNCPGGVCPPGIR